MADLTVCNEIRFLKVLGNDRDDRIVQDLSVGRLQSAGQFRHILSIHLEITHTTQGNESVWLNRNGSLIEFRTQFKVDVKRIARVNRVTGIAPLQLRFAASSLYFA